MYQERISQAIFIIVLLYLVIAPVSAAIAEFSYVGGTATASSTTGGYVPANLMDNNPVTMWWSNTYAGEGEYFQFDFGAGTTHKVSKYNLTGRDDSSGSNAPKDWILRGSTDAATWYELDNRTGQSFWNVLPPGLGETKEYSSFNRAANISAYRYYQVVIKKKGVPADYTFLSEWELWGDDSVADTTPPDSITNLINTTPSCSEGVYQWTNPKATDYYQLITWKNNVLNGNLSNSTTQVTWSTLNEWTWYNISTKTIDLSGNINGTFVNGSFRTAYCAPGGPTTTATTAPTAVPTPPNLPADRNHNWLKDWVEPNAWWLILLLGAVVVLKRK